MLRRGGPRAQASAATSRGATASAATGRLGWWLAAATLALPPLVIVPGAIDAFRLPQRLVGEWLALASLVPLVLAVEPAGWRRLPRHPAVLAVAPLVVVASLGLATTSHPQHVGEALLDLWIGALALIGWAVALPAARRRRLLAVLPPVAALLAAVGVLQALRLWNPMVFAEGDVGLRMRVTSLLGNPGDLAAFLVLPALIAQTRLCSARGWRRWGWTAMVGLLVYAVAATQTYTALAALALASATFWTLVLPWRRTLLAGAGLALTLLLLLALAPGLRERLVVSIDQLGQRNVGYVLTGRLDGWRVAAEVMRSEPLTGAGHGAYRAEFARTKLAMAARGETFFLGHQSATFVNAHNEYLEVGAELGVPGLAALAAGLVVLAVAARRVGRRQSAAERALVWAGLVGLGVLAFAYFPLHVGPVAFGWLAFLAWLTGAAADEEAAA